MSDHQVPLPQAWEHTVNVPFGLQVLTCFSESGGGWHINLFPANYCSHCHKSTLKSPPPLLKLFKCNIVFSIRHWRARSFNFFFSIMKYIFSLPLVFVIHLQLETANTKQTIKRAEGTEWGAGMKILPFPLIGTLNQTKHGPKPILLTNLPPLLHSQSLKAESTFTDPYIPRKLACIRTKELSCYIRKSKWSEKTTHHKCFKFSSENTTNSTNANPEHYRHQI